MQALVSILAESSNARATFLAGFGLHETGLDLTDGVRMSTSTGRILHVRPSGNLPSFGFTSRLLIRRKRRRPLSRAWPFCANSFFINLSIIRNFIHDARHSNYSLRRFRNAVVAAFAKSFPKQFVSLIGDETLFQSSARRVSAPALV